MSATVNRFNLGRPEDCVIPANAVVKEMKYCELCGKPFVRKFAATVSKIAAWISAHGYLRGKSEIRVDAGQKLCDLCLYRPFTQEERITQLAREQEQYKEQFVGIKSSTRQLPRFERPVGRETAAHRDSRKPPRSFARKRVNWQPIILAAFRERGRLTAEDMCELIPDVHAPNFAYMRVKNMFGNRLRRVADAPRRVKYGPAPGVFVLEGVTPEPELYRTAREVLQ